MFRTRGYNPLFYGYNPLFYGYNPLFYGYNPLFYGCGTAGFGSQRRKLQPLVLRMEFYENGPKHILPGRHISCNMGYI
jgi:hypothetical protein